MGGPVIIADSDYQDFTFHNAATAAADGQIYKVRGKKTLTVEIYGTSTSRTVLFKCRGPGATDRSLLGTNLASYATGTNTTGTGEIWQFDITGLTEVLMDLSAVAGGNVTVTGRAVA